MNALGRFLGASRVGYGDMKSDDQTVVLTSDYTDGVTPITGEVPLDSIGKQAVDRQRRGQTMFSPDVLADPIYDPGPWTAIETRAFVSVPLIREARLKALLFVNQREVRHWSSEDLRLVEGVASRIWDAVERALAEAALRESQAHLTSLFQQNGAGFAECDLQGRFLSVNDHFCQLVDRSRDQLGDAGLVELACLNEAEPTRAAIAHVKTSGQSVTLEHRLMRPDGTWIWLASTMSQIAARRGRFDNTRGLHRYNRAQEG